MNSFIDKENVLLHQPKSGNLIWKYDVHYPKNLLGITKRFERSLDVDGSLIFAETKSKTMRPLLERNYQPTVIMSEVFLANEDYNYLKDLFKLA